LINKDLMLSDFRTLVCVSDKNEVFKYNFVGDEVFLDSITNTFSLQFCKLNIMNNGSVKNYYLVFHYKCNKCLCEYNVHSFFVACTLDKIKCKSEGCRHSLKPIKRQSVKRNFYKYYGMIGDDYYIFFSFTKLGKGDYNAVIFKIGNPWGQPTCYIVDVKGDDL